jgi:hypothetical protein
LRRAAFAPHGFVGHHPAAGPTGTDNLVEIISGTRPMTVEQYTAATRTWYESDGQYASWASVGDHHTR